MGVKINSIEITPELSTDTTDYLLGHILGKYVAEIDFTAEWIAEAGATADYEDMVFEADDDSVIWNGGNFEDEGFLVGDSVYIKDSSSNNGLKTIASISGNKMTFNEAIVDETSQAAIITGITECNAIRFRYNLIENSEAPTYESKTDNNELIFTGAADRTSVTYSNLTQQGVYKSNHLGTAKIKGKEIVSSASVSNEYTFATAGDTITQVVGDFVRDGFQVGDTIVVSGTTLNNGTLTITAVTPLVITVAENLNNETVATAVLTGGYYLNRFIIEHTFYITPFYLLAHLDDIKQLISPDYFFDANCLKYLYNIKLLYNGSNPNKLQDSGDVSLLGNTGWFNENFNGNIKRYYFNQKTTFYKISEPAVTIDYVDYNEPCVFEMYIVSEDSVWTLTDTKIVVSHFILPEAESEYINTSTEQDVNFMFDRVLITANDTITQSSNNTTSKQVFKNVKYVRQSASVLYVTGTIDLSSAYKTRIAELEDKNFVLAVTCQDKDLQTESSDIVCLVDNTENADGTLNVVRQYDTDLSNPNVGTIDNYFNNFPYEDTDSYSAGFFVENTLRGKSIISVDRANDALINDITINIKAVKTTGDEFTLETKKFDLTSAVVSGGAQEVNISEDRGFILGADNPFNEITLARRSDLDSGDIKYYELIYPFKIRWEDFIELTGVDTEFYDTALLKNGYNQNWNRYFDTADWSIKYEVVVNIEENDYVNEISRQSTVICYNYEEAEDWTQEIKIYDEETMTEITGNILSDKICVIEAIFTKTSGTPPALIDVEGMIEYEPFREGGIGVIRNINTVYEHESDSPFISVLGTKKLKKEKDGSVYTFTTNIDGSKLTGNPKISARIYEKCADISINVDINIKTDGNESATATGTITFDGTLDPGYPEPLAGIIIEDSYGNEIAQILPDNFEWDPDSDDDGDVDLVDAAALQANIDAAITAGYSFTIITMQDNAGTIEIEYEITIPSSVGAGYNGYTIEASNANISTGSASISGGVSAVCTLYLKDGDENVLALLEDFEWKCDWDGDADVDLVDAGLFETELNNALPNGLTATVNSYTGTIGDVDANITIEPAACEGLLYYGLSVGMDCNTIAEITNNPTFTGN